MIFDFHYHLLFKHYISKPVPPIEANVDTTGFAKILNNIFGGPFNSQSSPSIVASSPLKLGVVGVISLEHAFANRVLHVLGLDLSGTLKIDQDLFKRTREGQTTYYDEFKKQVDYYTQQEATLKGAAFGIEYLRRKDYQGQELDDIIAKLSAADSPRFMAFSIEGGHNLSNAPIRIGKSQSPEIQLKDIQDSSMLDFISLNLCHLSEIPEQSLGGFAHGVNKLSQIAFHSEDFRPKSGFGVSELGKKVIRQALTHADHPILIDVKHMSLYTRLHYYRLREKLIVEKPEVQRLPIISSHTGFTFASAADYIQNKRYKITKESQNGELVTIIEPENRQIGKTDDLINKGLYGNPWTINLFDEDIVEIMESRGMIGISLDQRILGASSPAVDSKRGKYFEGENVPVDECDKLFEKGEFPGVEKLLPTEALFAPRKERHFMLFCTHIVYAVRIGYEHVNWVEGQSPWDCISIGSDFDGLINPINGFDSAKDFEKLKDQLTRYLPEADKFLRIETTRKALDYNEDGTVNKAALDASIDKFLFNSGLRFIARYLRNWVD